MPTPSASEYTRRTRLLVEQTSPQFKKGVTGLPSRVTSLGLVNFLPNVRGYLRVVPRVTPPALGGSLRFTAGASPTSVSFSNDASLRPGTGAFTIEWFQYYQDSDQNAIVFSIGTFPSNDLCVVYGGTTMFLFTDGSASSVGSAVTKNVWQHVAVVGNGGADGARNVKVYVNGDLKLTRTANYNITQTDTLRIGNQSDASVPNGNYAGLLTNFRWVVGTALYTTTFTPPTTPLTAVSGTELLLTAATAGTFLTDSSVRNRTATNSGVTFSADTPF
jgi:hypothetical protein